MVLLSIILMVVFSLLYTWVIFQEEPVNTKDEPNPFNESLYFESKRQPVDWVDVADTEHDIVYVENNGHVHVETPFYAEMEDFRPVTQSSRKCVMEEHFLPKGDSIDERSYASWRSNTASKNAKRKRGHKHRDYYKSRRNRANQAIIDAKRCPIIDFMVEEYGTGLKSILLYGVING